MLAVSIPLMVVLAVVLTTSASASLTAAAELKGVSVARAITHRVHDWLDGPPGGDGADRRQHEGPGDPGARADLAAIGEQSKSYLLLAVWTRPARRCCPAGPVSASTRSGRTGSGSPRPASRS
jgi:hypothetical protein